MTTQERETAQVPALTACCWEAVALDREGVAAVERLAVETHPEAAIIRTCQRIEAYTLASCDCPAPTHREGLDALRHLTEVAAGLHSAVLGEAQILGQSRRAFDDADGALLGLGRTAVAAARALRAETEFDSHAGHLLDRGLSLSGITPSGRLLVLGTGVMARLVAERGEAIGFDEVLVAGRRPPRQPMPGAYLPLGGIGRTGPVTVVAGCLGSAANVIALEALPPAELVLDLGTPRNFAGAAEARVVTIADLLSDEAGRPHSVARRGALRERLHTLLDRELASRRETASTPVGALRASVERARRRELARIAERHPEIAPETLDALTRSLVNRILHEPTERLRAMGEGSDLARELAALFEEGTNDS
ncbi:MAG: hypothetical protein OXH07_06455 [Chloroflexi bacterium]|nr:hypothetical protein [Chloroflexota bacterium]